MTTHGLFGHPLDRAAELLVENDARVSRNGMRDLLEALDARAYQAGFEDGQLNADDCENETTARIAC